MTWKRKKVYMERASYPWYVSSLSASLWSREEVMLNSSRPQFSQSLLTYSCISLSIWFIELIITCYQDTHYMSGNECNIFSSILYFQCSVLITKIFSSGQTCGVLVRVPISSTCLVCTSLTGTKLEEELDILGPKAELPPYFWTSHLFLVSVL